MAGVTRSKRDSFVFAVFVAAFIHFALFQNCTGQRFSPVADAGTHPSLSVGGGSNGGFDGMVYAALGPCKSGHQSPQSESGSTLTYESIIALAGDFSSVTVMRRGCRDLPPAERAVYPAAEFTFASSDRNIVVLEGTRFVLVNRAQAPKPLVLAWSCSLVGGGEVAVYRDPQFPALFYNQYSGRNRAGAAISTDVVNAIHSVSPVAEEYATAPYDASATAPPPFIDVQVPPHTPGRVRVQDDAGGEVAATCASAGPTPTPTSTPAPTPTPTPTPGPPMELSAPRSWLYFGHISRTIIQMTGMPYCGVESAAPGSCSQVNSTCWIASGSYYDNYANDAFYNFFSCQ